MEILNSIYLISSPAVDKCPRPDRPEFAFIGRSNVGKSSLINMLCGRKELAKTSGLPGKTKLINHFEITSPMAGKKSNAVMKWLLADLPGYGFATVSKKERRGWEKMIEDYIRKRINLVNLFVLVDSRHQPQQIDLDFINRLGEWQVPFSIVFTKSDKNKPGATTRNAAAFLTALSKNWEVIPPYFISSAVERTGKKELLDHIRDLLST